MTDSRPNAQEQWLKLEVPKLAAPDMYRVAQFEERGTVLLGRSVEGYALLLRGANTGPRAPVVIRNLTVRFNSWCVVDDDDEQQERQRVTVVACTASDRRLQVTFVQAAVALLASRLVNDADFPGLIEALIDLFRASSRPPQSSLLGVWGELLVLKEASEPTVALQSWRSSVSDRYDFGRDAERIEVKTAVGTRRHHFSLRQLECPNSVRVSVISIVTETSAAGSTVPDLIAAVVSRSSDSDTGNQVISKVSEALGSDVARWADQRFDTVMARESRLLLPAHAIPRPSVADARVQEVRFVADLSTMSRADQESDIRPLAAALSSRGDALTSD